MTHLFFDESKHPQAEFCIGAFVCAPPVVDAITKSVLVRHGFDPDVHEFKSSARMERTPAMRDVRRGLAAALYKQNCAVAVTVARTPVDLARASLHHLSLILKHCDFAAGGHEAFFDEGLYSDREITRAPWLAPSEGSTTARCTSSRTR